MAKWITVAVLAAAFIAIVIIDTVKKIKKEHSEED